MKNSSANSVGGGGASPNGKQPKRNRSKANAAAAPSASRGRATPETRNSVDKDFGLGGVTPMVNPFETATQYLATALDLDVDVVKVREERASALPEVRQSHSRLPGNHILLLVAFDCLFVDNWFGGSTSHLCRLISYRLLLSVRLTFSFFPRDVFSQCCQYTCLSQTRTSSILNTLTSGLTGKSTCL